MVVKNNMIFGTGLSAEKEYVKLKKTIQIALENNIFSFDTAPSYGTEISLGLALNELMDEKSVKREELFVQTKVDAWQMQEGNGNVRSYILDILKKMKMDYFDAVLIHWPIPEYMTLTWKTMKELQQDGFVKNLGICNLNMRHINNLLSHDISPDIIQIERHPLYTANEVVDYCINNNILLQAYSPLCKMNEKIACNAQIAKIAEKYGKNIGQVVLRWHIDSGVVPIFTSSKEYRIKEYANIFDFNLTTEEIEIIKSTNINYKMYLESISCPGY